MRNPSVILGLWLFLSAGWTAAWAAEPAFADAPTATAESSARLNKALIDTVCGKILAGDYTSAGTMLDTATVPPSPGSESLKAIVGQLRQIGQQRQQDMTDARSKAEADLKPYRDTPPANDKDRDKAFAALLGLRDTLPDNQKTSLLQDPFVQKLMQDARDSAETLRSQGRWADAYSHGLFWLRLLDKDNLQFEKQADDLIARASLALALKDGPCDAAADRFQGVQKDMLLKAIMTLDFRYVECGGLRRNGSLCP